MMQRTRTRLVGLLLVVIALVVMLTRLGLIPGIRAAATANPAAALKAAQEAGQPVFLEFYGAG